MSNSPDRSEYMRDAGMILVCDWAHQFFTDVRFMPVEQITSRKTPRDCALEPSAGGLWRIADTISENVKELRGGTFERPKGYGVTQNDYSGPENKYAFGRGFADADFLWHFVPYVAKGVIDQFVADGLLSSDRTERMTLHDWATVIRRPWFKDIVHDMALADNGLWASKGKSEHDYRNGSLQSKMKIIFSDAQFRPFNTSLEEDPISGLATLRADMNDEFHKKLRERMRHENSPGCPAARHAGSVAISSMNNPHGQSLADHGWVDYPSVNEKKQTARYHQAMTPIDHGIEILAVLFDEYETKYGTPYLPQRYSSQLTHKQEYPVQPLMYVAPKNAQQTSVAIGAVIYNNLS